MKFLYDEQKKKNNKVRFKTLTFYSHSSFVIVKRDSNRTHEMILIYTFAKRKRFEKYYYNSTKSAILWYVCVCSKKNSFFFFTGSLYN